MAFFGVTKEEIVAIKPHTNADKLELGYLRGMNYQFILGKGEWKVGDKCLYFPIDSVLPVSIIDKLGMTGKLAGPWKNRIKTVKLRGQISMGLIGPLSLIYEMPNWEKATSEEITKFLGITKHEPPIVFAGGTHRGKMIPLPFGLRYDLENAERHPVIVEQLMDQKIYITEKLEGSQFSCGYHKETNHYFVNTSGHGLIENPEETSPYWETARKYKLFDFAKSLDSMCNQRVVIYGEFAGPSVQGNLYKLKEHKIFIFDIKIDDRFIDSFKFWEELARDNPQLDYVPTLERGFITLREWLNGKTLQEASNGDSCLYNGLREGIVIKPAKEE